RERVRVRVKAALATDMTKSKQKRGNPPAKFRYAFLPILTGSDLSRRRLPFMAAECLEPGPVVWLTACGHGDEVGGIVVIQDIFKRLRKKELRKGSVYAFPLMNPIGFETSSRNITLTKEDLNRSFPGSADGSLGERIAHKIFSTITQTEPTLVLDLHNDWVNSIPYTFVDPDPGADYHEVYEKTILYSKQSGLLVIGETDVMQKALSQSLLKENIPALTLEFGESYVVNEANIEYGVKSIWNILSYLEMVEPLSESFDFTLLENYKGSVLTYSDAPFSSTSGIIRFLVRPGDLVKKGQPIARIYNAFGRLQETLAASNDSIVLGHADSSVAFPGMRAMAFGVPQSNQ
ncbi:MAG: M14 family metallopeptidase, partial [bacterium]